MRYFVVVTEHDSWSGPDIIAVKEYATKELCQKIADGYNRQNTDSVAPEYYITASVSTDLNLTLHKNYKDLRNHDTIIERQFS